MNILNHGPNTLFYSKYHLLGDLAYSNRNWLITPFKDYGNLRIRHRKFNTKHSKTRVSIENTFGLLKGRWRRLLFIDTCDLKMASMIILACCVLHNFCLLNEDFLDDCINEENSFIDDHQDFNRNYLEVQSVDNKRQELLDLLVPIV